MDLVWIDFRSSVTQAPARLHGLWLAADGAYPDRSPVMLYLHGARWNVEGPAPRIRRMQELGFSVLAIDYRGFGKNTSGLPSEATAYEDARGAWDWLALLVPGALITQRFDSLAKVAKINSPLLVVHGKDDSLVASALAKKLYDAALGRKRFVLIEGGSHFSTMSVGREQYRDALVQLFSLRMAD